MSKKYKKRAFTVVMAMLDETAQRDLYQQALNARRAANEARETAENYKAHEHEPELSDEQADLVSGLYEHLSSIIEQHRLELMRQHPELCIHARLYMDAHLHEESEAE